MLDGLFEDHEHVRGPLKKHPGTSEKRVELAFCEHLTSLRERVAVKTILDTSGCFDRKRKRNHVDVKDINCSP